MEATAVLKIPSSASVRAADAHTIATRYAHSGSVGLMYRAALQASVYVQEQVPPGTPLLFVCGPGNNGGDGLCMAGILQAFYPVQAVIVAANDKRSADFQYYLQELHKKGIQPVHYEEWNKELPAGVLIIDCILGTGLSGEPRAIFADAIRFFNTSGVPVWSIDLPSGMQGDHNGHIAGDMVIRARRTLCFQAPRLSFFFAENEQYTGSWHVLDIGLDTSLFEPLAYINTVLNPEAVSRFTYKNRQGKALLLAGSEAMPGAAVLAAGAALRSGAGYVYALVPAILRTVLLLKYPQLMLPFTDAGGGMPDLSYATAIGAGPGMGTGEEALQQLTYILKNTRVPLVLDADALTLLARYPALWEYAAGRTVITPHPGEFDRITGRTYSSGYERWQAQIVFAREKNVTCILKGAYTSICNAEGMCWFNTSGTPGMARAGSGDVLTGLLTGFMAAGMALNDAARYAVWLHGKKGEEAWARYGSAMNAGDIFL